MRRLLVAPGRVLAVGGRLAFSRRGAAGLSPVEQLIADLGGDSAVVGLYLADQSLAPGSLTVDGSNRVSQWADVRGAGAALAQATQANQPILDVARVDFDGVDDWMRADSAQWNDLGEDSAFALVGEFPSSRPDFEMLLEYRQTALGDLTLGGSLTAPSNIQTRGRGGAQTPDLGTFAAGVRVLHGRLRFVSGTQTRTVGARHGDDAEVTETGITGSSTIEVPDRLTIGANGVAGTPALLSAAMVLVYKGADYNTASKYAIVNAFAQTYLGATL